VDRRWRGLPRDAERGRRRPPADVWGRGINGSARLAGGARLAASRARREEEESGRGKNVISPLFSLLNRLQPVRGVLWPNFTEPECLLAKCSKVAARQQRIITLDVQQTIIP